ncbi:MAG: hypothetical protein QOH43_2477 [Solirubrobacteraceae bacterium]|jgi:hypothetical protein|nr:hypothetical protein [Solirubrobacteraceae bacterium]
MDSSLGGWWGDPRPVERGGYPADHRSMLPQAGGVRTGTRPRPAAQERAAATAACP